MCIRLAQLDHRIRGHITHKLRYLAEDTSACRSCSSNAAFQLTVFLSLGFGVGPSEREWSQMLSKSGKSEADRDAIILEITNQPYGEGPWNLSLMKRWMQVFHHSLMIRTATAITGNFETLHPIWSKSFYTPNKS